MVTFELKLTLGAWLNFPFFVVITITPLPEKAPQIDAAAASRRMSMLSTSFGLMFDKSPSYGKLSTTISGLGLELIVLRPSIVMAALLPLEEVVPGV